MFNPHFVIADIKNTDVNFMIHLEFIHGKEYVCQISKVLCFYLHEQYQL